MAGEENVARNTQGEVPAYEAPPPYAPPHPVEQPTSAAGPPGTNIQSSKESPATDDGTASRYNVRGPVLVMILAYGVMNLWDFVASLSYLGDPNPSFNVFVINVLVFDAAVAALAVLGFIAFQRTNLTLMGVYVWSMIALGLMNAALIALAAVTPMPRELQDEINRATEAAKAQNLPTDRFPTESDYKFHKALGSAAQLGIHILLVFIARRYYLSARAAAAQKQLPASNREPASETA